ncbi:Zn-dependent hydrolase [Haloplanus aerogenes]|uniref:N-carbamoyl-L-amino-acid hydrolase n=1 Tax=Haloplanus aerogenes TaxID=660522 RepID=A0A3M0CNJ7_9EURY|nr:Zn-dependent hydrolase [Haloplanus aerogenes]AZH24823.1 Zn-dependent hydrolase [Haloplanus aerogenes]RMB08366.1 N-carbamoyl-L-amino-acid hydrolase [Haloplanus aerogenes]
MPREIHDCVDEERLRNDIRTNAEYGAVPVDEGNCRTVLTGTEANRSAREYFVNRLEAAGLDVRVDAVGNIAGRWVPETADPTAPAVATGSHLDSVPRGGIFDGVLGVYGALEAIRALQSADVSLARPLDVVCFTEEEGSRFSDGVLGSSVASGQRTVEAALALEDDEGVTLDEALTDIGFRGTGRIDASDWDSWLELHVEQSERLEDAGAPVGIVTSITGTIRCLIEIAGEANHSGCTAMHDRRDALAAASEVVLDVERTTNEVVEEYGETVVGTVGKLDVAPNAINVVPGRVELGIDVRDVSYEPMELIVDRVRERLSALEDERGVVTTFERPYDIEPIGMSDRCTDALRAAASASSVDALELHSGAGHDTMHIAKVTDAGMLFAPSRDGVSHSPMEWTDWDSCAAVTQVMATALADLAAE